MKARLNVEGSRLMEPLARELDFPYKRNGSLVLCFDIKDIPALQKLCDQGRENGVKGLEILDGEQLKKLEPTFPIMLWQLSTRPQAASFAPSV